MHNTNYCSIIYIINKQIRRQREWETRQREDENLKKERIFTPDNSLYRFLKDIGVSELIIPILDPCATSSIKSLGKGDAFDRAMMKYLVRDDTPGYFELRTMDQDKKVHPYVQTSDGESGVLIEGRWDSHNGEFRVGLLIDGRDAPDYITVPGLREACDMKYPGWKAPWRPSIWKWLRGR